MVDVQLSSGVPVRLTSDRTLHRYPLLPFTGIKNCHLLMFESFARTSYTSGSESDASDSDFMDLKFFIVFSS